jgi:isoquinoline 1-oxidoreductase alpha subunit
MLWTTTINQGVGPVGLAPIHPSVGGRRVMIELTVNGEARQFDGDPEMPLLWYLRDELQLTGSKYGCGIGLCGACTIHVDGEAQRSCTYSVGDAAGTEITTIEGLSDDGTHPVQQAWRELNVPQCGFCQAGQIMQAAALIEQNPNPSDLEIVETMQGNVCRCGCYQRIAAAVRQAATGA